MKQQICLIFSLFLLSALNTAAQQIISGTVYVDRRMEPLIGAMVTVPGTNIGTTTDADGKFKLEIPDHVEKISVLYSGFKDKEVLLTRKTGMKIFLQEYTVKSPDEYDHNTARIWNQERLNQVMKKSLSLGASNKFHQAIDFLDGQLYTIPQGEDNTGYFADLLFTKGYLYHQYSPEDVNTRMKNAKENYQRSSRYDAQNIDLVNNLIIVCRTLEDWRCVERYTKLAMSLDPGNGSKWKIILAEAAEMKGEYSRAWEIYSQLIGDSDKSRTAAQKLVSLYPHLYDWGKERLVQKCIELDNMGISEPALQGMQDLMIRSCTTRDYGGLEETEVLAWARILIRNGWTSAKLNTLLSQLGKARCENPITRMLINQVTVGWNTEPGRDNWWFGNEKRVFYFNGLQKGWADHLLSKGKREEAIHLYSDCYNKLRHMQDYSMEIFGTEGALEMDVLTRLAQLYGASDHFRELESQIFHQKGEAYRSNDLDRIFKFHLILGQIYVNREQWTGGHATNAEFQLSRAAETAELIFRNDPKKYKPYPGLYEKLALTYAKNNNPQKAIRTYQDAAIGYLETDHVQLSESMSEKARQYLSREPDSELQARQNEIRLIQDARSLSSGVGETSFHADNENYYRNEKAFEWIENPDLIGSVSPAILERQKFKVLADLSDQAGKAGAQEAFIILRKEARGASQEITILSSYQDLVRLKKISADQDKPNSKILKAGLDEDHLKSRNEKILPKRSNQQIRVIKTRKN